MIALLFVMKCDGCHDFFGRSGDADADSPDTWKDICASFILDAEKSGWVRDKKSHICPDCMISSLIPEEEVCPCCR